MARPDQSPRIELTEHFLLEHLALGRERRTAWSEVRRVRWLAPGRAEVVCADGHVVPIQSEPEEVETLVRALSRQVLENQERWRTHGVPAKVVCEWLGIGPGERWRRGIGDRPLTGTAALPAVALAAYIMCSAFPALGAWLLLPVVIVALYLVGRGAELLPCSHAITADGDGMHWTTDGRTQSVRWCDLRGMDTSLDHRGEQVFARVTFHTTGEEATVMGDELWLQPLIRTACRVLNARRSYLTIGDLPVPDTALSPARVVVDETAERGLSRSESAE